MTSAARVVFAVLVAATFGAFFVAQRLKHTPTVLQRVTGPLVFSPNGDGRQDRLPLSFELKSTDTISVDVIDRDGDPVRSLVSDRRVVAHHRVSMVWNGRTDEHRRAPDGRYRIRVTLRDEARTVVIRHSYRLDTVPPRPRVVSITPSTAPGPELLPNAAHRVVIHTKPTGSDPSITIWRTSGPAPRRIVRLRMAHATAVWDGKLGGRAVPHGTYVAVAQWRDGAGNLGSSVPVDRAGGAPVLRYGETFPGRGGITVRYLELQPPTDPTPAGSLFTVGVDARGASYRWDLRALGATRPVRSGVTTHTPLRLSAPRGVSGVYLFEVHSGGRSAATPIAVNGPPSGRVLVVLPLMTWQGRNAVDDDGDGTPDTLDRGATVRTGRVFAGGALPQGFRAQEGPLLAFLARRHRGFDITTDVALAAGRGPSLTGHHGVLLPGDTRWLPGRLQVALRSFVHGGGTLLLTGTDSLRRDVTLTADGRLEHPTPPAGVNLFGSKLRPVTAASTTVTNLNDAIELFSGGTGLFSGYPGAEPTAALGSGETLAANAVTPDNQTVIVAARYGKGLEIRTSLLDFATRLNTDSNAAALVLRAWTLLAGV